MVSPHQVWTILQTTTRSFPSSSIRTRIITEALTRSAGLSGPFSWSWSAPWPSPWSSWSLSASSAGSSVRWPQPRQPPLLRPSRPRQRSFWPGSCSSGPRLRPPRQQRLPTIELRPRRPPTSWQISTTGGEAKKCTTAIFKHQVRDSDWLINHSYFKRFVWDGIQKSNGWKMPFV